MLKDLCEKHVLGKVIAYVYVIEFQKRDLPHAYILLILALKNKLQFAKHYDSIVSAKISDFVMHSLAYETVVSIIMHDLYGKLNPTAPYMKDDMCQKHYPKSFQENIKENYDGFPIYRR